MHGTVLACGLQKEEMDPMDVGGSSFCRLDPSIGVSLSFPVKPPKRDPPKETFARKKSLKCIAGVSWAELQYQAGVSW